MAAMDRSNESPTPTQKPSTLPAERPVNFAVTFSLPFWPVTAGFSRKAKVQAWGFPLKIEPPILSEGLIGEAALNHRVVDLDIRSRRDTRSQQHQYRPAAHYSMNSSVRSVFCGSCSS